MGWILRLGAAWLALSVLGGPCFAQTRTMNTNSPGVLRSWPADGKWQVLLVHASDGRYVCLTLTGKKSDGALSYLLGIDVDPSNLYVFVADRNPEAVQGETVKVLIDNTLVDSYEIDKHLLSGDLSQVRAAVPKAQSGRLLNLLKVGAVVQFETAEATYSVSLDGMTEALTTVQKCLTEATALRSAN